MTETQTSAIPLEQYKEFHRLMPIACIDIVLVQNDSFLLVKRKNAPVQGKWWLPGGRILRDERFADAAERKALQETGLRVQDLKLLGVDETFFTDGPFGKSTHTINIIFQGTAKSERVTIDDQSEEYHWFDHINETWDPYIKKFLSIAGFRIS